MKKYIFISIIFLYAPCTAQNKVEETILKAFDAIAATDIDKLRSSCTDDFILIEDGVIWNRDSLVNAILPRKKDDTFRRENKISFITTKTDGNTAWTCYSNEAKGISKGSPFIVNWIESAVLVKESDEWKIQLLHSSRIERK